MSEFKIKNQQGKNVENTSSPVVECHIHTVCITVNLCGIVERELFVPNLVPHQVRHARLEHFMKLKKFFTFYQSYVINFLARKLNLLSAFRVPK